MLRSATRMTGLMPPLHGVRRNGIPLSLKAATLTDLMAAAGFGTALTGKRRLRSIEDDLPVIGTPEPAHAARRSIIAREPAREG